MVAARPRQFENPQVTTCYLLRFASSLPSDTVLLAPFGLLGQAGFFAQAGDEMQRCVG